MHGKQEVSGSIPLTSTTNLLHHESASPGVHHQQSFQQQMFHRSTAVSASSRSSRGLGHYPFTVVTGVRIPYGTPNFSL